MKTCVLTGFAGFIGYHFAKRLLADGWLIYGVDINPDSYNGKHIQFDQNFKLIGRDICDLKELPDCDYVFHLAAQTHVHNSIQDCKEFIRTNIEGTRNLLELIKNKSENILQKPTMVYFSTDEVYGDIEEGFATEEFPLAPTNNYAVTKAAADQLVQSYGRTYGMDYLIIRPTNNYGTHQNSEKFIPLTLKLHLMGKKVKLHNRGTPVRNWLHVEDTCDAVLHILEKGFSKGCQQIYNVGGNLSQINYETARQIFMALNTFDFHAELDLESHRPGQDMRYAVDCSKLLETNWKWKKEFQDSLPKIVQWYLDDPVRRLF